MAELAEKAARRAVGCGAHGVCHPAAHGKRVVAFSRQKLINGAAIETQKRAQHIETALATET
ncbi:MAG: hypothetical protein II815_08695 [Bacteroidales bacterium]|nr:hypothetical protein [Bacteroidales bacterium]